jgi:hypothetical protein
MRRMAPWLAVGVLGFVVASACSSGFGIESVLGIWNTRSINGYSVPGTVVYEGVSYDTEYVRWAFYDGGQCTVTQRVDGVTATYDECHYDVNAEQETTTIVFLSEVWDGSVEGNSMTLTDPKDLVWVLREQ